jgi:hypothetical protein
MKIFVVSFIVTFAVVYGLMVLIEPTTVLGMVGIGAIGGFLGALLPRIIQ